MILTVTLNPAWDVTYLLDEVQWEGTNRVGEVLSRAGGKGINVARILATLGSEVIATGFLGGVTGAAMRADLATAGLAGRFCEIDGGTRRTISVVDRAHHQTAIFNEPGPHVTAERWNEFTHLFRELVTGIDAVVLSGSLPPGLPTNAYATLIAIATERRVRTVLDADGEALSEGLRARPNLVKPNAAELQSFIGRATGSPGEVWEAVAAMRAAGAEAIVASLGPEGMIAETTDGRWRVKPPERIDGNPIGAGDAAVAALSLGMVGGVSWERRLSEAAAASAAAVFAPCAGAIDVAMYRRLLPRVQVERS